MPVSPTDWRPSWRLTVLPGALLASGCLHLGLYWALKLSPPAVRPP